MPLHVESVDPRGRPVLHQLSPAVRGFIRRGEDAVGRPLWEGNAYDAESSDWAGVGGGAGPVGMWWGGSG
ncbi:hypothetical protein GCM10009788_13930 [Nocardioides humi]|uniref:Uncharacterized protein n=1 Tax=Nocardioides humi TaxID=449461 RepID=A0ABN2A4B6_9ACTN